MNNRPVGITWSALLWIAPVAFLGVFYFYPLGSILGLSLGRDTGGQALWAALVSQSTGKVLAFTVWQAALSTVLTLALGLPGAFLMARYEFFGKTLIRVLTGIPFVMPTLVVAAGFNALLGPQGWINSALMGLFHLSSPPIKFINTLAAILVAHVFYNTTIVLRMVGDYWAHMDPRLGQAAQILGANRWQSLWKVTLPLLLPSIVAAALLVFIFDFTSFGVVLVLGGPKFVTLEVEIYYQTVSLFDLRTAAILSLLQLAFTLGLTVVYAHLASSLARPISLHPRKFTSRRLVRWRDRLMVGGYLAILMVWMAAPLLALAARSITRFDTVRRSEEPGRTSELELTLDYYRELNINRRKTLFYAPPGASIAISLGYAAVTVLLALGLGFPASLALSRRSAQGLMAWMNRLFDPLLMLPLGTSAITLGLGFIVALDKPPVDLRASAILIPLAHTLVAFPFVVRSLTPALLSIRPRLRQAAAVLGAGPLQVLRHVDLPLVGRAAIVAAAFAFTISLGEFGATALVARPEYPTVPLAIYRLISQPGPIHYGQALALGTILMGVCAAGMFAIEKFRIADIGEF